METRYPFDKETRLYDARSGLYGDEVFSYHMTDAKDGSIHVIERVPVIRDEKGRVKSGHLTPYQGIPKRQAMMMARLDKMTPQAIANLERLMTCGNPAVELGATKEILDRTLGKVRQKVDVSVTDTAQAHLAALVELNERAKQRQQQVAAGDDAKDVTPNQSVPTIIDADVIGEPDDVP